jgi:hypothetical protein
MWNRNGIKICRHICQHHVFLDETECILNEKMMPDVTAMVPEQSHQLKSEKLTCETKSENKSEKHKLKQSQEQHMKTKVRKQVIHMSEKQKSATMSENMSEKTQMRNKVRNQV